MKPFNDSEDVKAVNDDSNRVDLGTKCGLGISKTFNFGNLSGKEETKNNGD